MQWYVFTKFYHVSCKCNLSKNVHIISCCISIGYSWAVFFSSTYSQSRSYSICYTHIFRKMKQEIQEPLRYSHILHILLKFTQFVNAILKILNDQNILQQLCLWFYLPLFTIIRKILNNRPQQKLQVLHPIPISHFYALLFCEWKRHCEYHIKLLSVQS